MDAFTHGSYGRIQARDGTAYDPVGRRLDDDRFRYRWDWRGQLVEVTVGDTWPDADGDGEADASPYAGHRVTYHYDARGRLLRRLHEGADDGSGTRPFIEERRYVWEEDRLAAEAAYGPSETGENLRWRKTYVPGPTGLDDPPQVVVEILQPGSPFSGQARTYTYVTDELGTVVGLVAEDEGTDPNAPPVPVRYRYTPYGEAHAETGPELLRARFDGDAVAVETSAGPVTQTVADELTAAAGGIVLRWSIPVDEATLATGLAVEQLVAGSGWAAVAAGELAMGPKPQEGLGTADDETELRILLSQGWQRATSYRVRLTAALEDRLGRTLGPSSGPSETLQWTIPAAEEGQPIPPVQYDQRFPTVYESYQAAGANAGARFPGGQTRLFQGLWTDPVTGLSYARARWYDPRNAAWLSEDPLLDVDSPNLYAFVAWQPNMGRDPLGRYQQDAHYSVVFYMSYLATRDQDLSLDLAYASQYVDNFGGTAPAGVDAYLDHHEDNGFFFGTLRAFHFATYGGEVVTPKGPLPRLIVNEAIASRNAMNLGVALHTLADSYSHAGFTWREDPVNDQCSALGGALLHKVGHADCEHRPDQPYRSREQAEAAADAAFAIFDAVSRFYETKKPELARFLRHGVERNRDSIRQQLIANFLRFNDSSGEDRSNEGWGRFIKEQLGLDLSEYDADMEAMDELLGEGWRGRFTNSTLWQRRLVDREDGTIQEHIASDPALHQREP